MTDEPQQPTSGFSIEVTDPEEFYCFRLRALDSSGQTIEIMLHATSLVALIHEASCALCEWQAATTSLLLERLTGSTGAQLRESVAAGELAAILRAGGGMREIVQQALAEQAAIEALDRKTSRSDDRLVDRKDLADVEGEGR